MRVCIILILFIGLPGVTCFYNFTEGQNVTVKCLFKETARTYLFCRNNCNEGVLVQTSRNYTENGRYSIRYEEETGTVHVGIRNVKMSDAGKYVCKFDIVLMFDKYKYFWIHITNAHRELNLTEDFRLKIIPQATAPDSAKTGGVLYLRFALAAAVILVSVALAIFCWNKNKNKLTKAPVNSGSAEIPECDRVYEEIPEDTPASVGDSTASDIYSLASAPAHSETEDRCDTVHYSELEISRNSAPHSQTEALRYPPVQTENTLYSTVSKAQSTLR